jgi:hypothetical protein
MGNLGYTCEFGKTYCRVYRISQKTFCSAKITAVHQLDPLTKKCVTEYGLTLCTVANRLAEIPGESHMSTYYL